MYMGGGDKELLILGLLFNISALGYFKYYDFFATNINLALQTDLPILNIILPLGISFFTFQQISFLIDSYRGNREDCDFLSYCLFVTFFPQLIAGPIVFTNEMLPQFENHNNKKIDYENMNRGLYLFAIGLAKKVILADSIAPFANAGFDKMSTLTFMEGWLTSISYTMQLYFDFSGYCDMAMGIALMFNIVLPLNFNSPYKAVNIQDFWKRWHMTLGRFLTNYLYIPLGGNRKGETRTLINLLIVFLASGIWHGAGWNFILWGGLHGIGILIHRVWKNKGLSLPNFLGWLITLFSVNVFWVFFRAKTFQDAMKVVHSMVDIGSVTSFMTTAYKQSTMAYLGNRYAMVILVCAILLSLVLKNSKEKEDNMQFGLSSLETIFYIAISITFLQREATFLYFNF